MVFFLSAPYGALYLTSNHASQHSHSELLVQCQCNWKQLKQLLSGSCNNYHMTERTNVLRRPCFGIYVECIGGTFLQSGTDFFVIAKHSLRIPCPVADNTWRSVPTSSTVLVLACTTLVHCCYYISLWWNIVQGGNPLYADVNNKRACGGHIWPNWVQFFAKKTWLICLVH